MSNLVRYEAARNALAAAHKVDEVKDIRDKAEAMAAYARQAKDSELIQYATEIKVRAERRCGELLRDTAARGERASAAANLKQAPKSEGSTSAPTLSDMGLTRDESSRYQQLAAMPTEHFETAVATAKATAGEVTTAFMLREAKAVAPSVKAAATKKANAEAKAKAKSAAMREAEQRSQLVIYAEPLLRALRRCVALTPEEQRVMKDLRTEIARLATT